MNRLSIIRAKAVIGGLSLAGALIASAPPAKADPAHDDAQLAYTVDLARVGIAGTPYKEVVVGETVCDNLAHGMPLVATANRLINGAGIPASLAVSIVSLAVIDLCPQFTPNGLVAPPTPAAPVPVTIVRALV